MEQTINDIKNIRVEIDGLFKITSALNPANREVSLAKTHFEESKMSLGKVLGYIGSANPYPESKNPENKVIEKTADTEDRNLFFKDPNDRIGNVKSIRRDAGLVSDKLQSISLPADRSDQCQAFFTDAFLQLEKGSMWLGMELGRIKAEADKKALEEIPQSNHQEG